MLFSSFDLLFFEKNICREKDFYFILKLEKDPIEFINRKLLKQKFRREYSIRITMLLFYLLRKEKKKIKELDKYLRIVQGNKFLKKALKVHIQQAVDNLKNYV